MTQKAPGKSEREGITLMQAFDMFPDDATAEGVVCQAALAGRSALPVLRW